MGSSENARGGLGWVILVVALAVPGVLFYNWWSHLRAEREKAVAAKARGRVPDGGVFQASPNAKLVNPMTPAAATPIAPAPAPEADVLAGPGEAQAAQVETSTAIAAASAAVKPNSFSSSTATTPPLKRDPTLSPFDRVRIREEEEVQRRLAEDFESMKRGKKDVRKLRKPKAVDVQSLVKLQGVISNAESGYKAIVNNDVVGVGEFVGRTKIKVVRITDMGVTFEFEGKRFSAGVSRD